MPMIPEERFPKKENYLPVVVCLALTAFLGVVNAGAVFQTEVFGVRLIQTATIGEAEKLRARIESGASFPDMARTYSMDPTAASGGYLGTVAIEDLRPAYRDALSGVGRGEIINPVPVDGRYVILQLATDAEEAWLGLTDAGRQALRQGRVGDAEEHFSSALTATEDFGDAGRYLLVESLRNLSALLQVKGDDVEARRLYERSMEAAWGTHSPVRDSGVSDVLEAFTDLLALVALEDEAFPSAVDRYTEAIRNASLAERLFLAMSNILDVAGLTNETELTLMLAVEDFPASTSALGELADYHIDSGRVTQAIEEFQRAIRMEPGTSVDPSLGVVPASYFYQRIGDAYGSLVRYEDAADAYRMALEIDPGNPGARFELGLLHYVNNRHEDALGEYGIMSETNPENVDLLHRIAEAQLGTGRAEEAIETLERALELGPDHRRSRYTLGTALVRMGRVEEGRAELARFGELEAAASANDSLSRELSMLDSGARAALGDGEYQRGVELYRQAIDVHPGVALFRLNLALAQSQLGRHDDALDALEAVAELGLSDNALVFKAIADAYAAQGDAETSEKHQITYLQRLDAWLRSALE